MTVTGRNAHAIGARQGGVENGKSLDDEITDVNQSAVEALIRKHGVDILLHGHTHRPAIHEVRLGDRTATRIVLGDWFEQGSVVRWNADGPRLEEMSR